MMDREKVIKGLGRVSNDIVDGYITEPDMACNTINDAIDLLKAQEPKPARIEGSDVIQVGYCPNCDKLLQPWGAKYCYECGQAVKWE